MKQVVSLMMFLMPFGLCMAQLKPSDLDKSPLDVAYYPVNYPVLKMRGHTSAEPMARVIYSRPQKNGREIFGTEVKYNEVWRLGANEATELELFRNANIGGKKVPKGRYSLYCLPAEDKWTIIINKDNYSWGSFTYQAAKDVARVSVPVKKNGEAIEAFTMYFEGNNNPSLVIMWDDLKVNVPFSF